MAGVDMVRAHLWLVTAQQRESKSEYRPAADQLMLGDQLTATIFLYAYCRVLRVLQSTYCIVVIFLPKSILWF